MSVLQKPEHLNNVETSVMSGIEAYTTLLNNSHMCDTLYIDSLLSTMGHMGVRLLRSAHMDICIALDDEQEYQTEHGIVQSLPKFENRAELLMKIGEDIPYIISSAKNSYLVDFDEDNRIVAIANLRLANNRLKNLITFLENPKNTNKKKLYLF